MATKQPYVYQEYPKWVEYDGRKFIVQSMEEELPYIREAEKKVVEMPKPVNKLKG